MIEQSRFLGLSMRVRSQRRLLVILYACFVLGMASIPIIRGKTVLAPMCSATFALAGLLGGIKAGGPVKPYSESPVGAPKGSGIQELDLDGRKPKPTVEPLDEREIHERDQAHYTAFRLLRWTVPAGALFVVILINIDPSWLMRNYAILIWLMVIYIFSLPQTVILWTEPGVPPDDEQSEPLLIT